ncbi:uncharacterized protein YpmB [Alkalibacillus flavidus]|uniref:Uncharacterized protein YpmB n=1 Tax=Alkalibacillus flavidus TaxID=546021 RepID=A0ABV2KRW0_9BACI
MSVRELFQQKWFLMALLIVLVVTIATIVVSMILYYAIEGDHDNQQQTYQDVALELSPVQEVNQRYTYHGEEAYTVIRGEGDDGSYFVFVPQQDSLNSDDIDWIKANDVLSESAMLDQFQEECSDCHLEHITPGIINDDYVWELTYESNDRLVYRTYTMEDGDVYDSISFSQN